MNDNIMRHSSVNLGCSIGDLIRRLRCLDILSLSCTSTYKLPDDLNSCVRTSWLSRENLAGLVNNKHATRSTLRRLLQPDSRDERLCRIAQQRVWQLLLRLESSVRLWAVVREAVNTVAGGGEGCVFVAEGAGLFGACCSILAHMFR
jgi:hypothetical protein